MEGKSDDIMIKELMTKDIFQKIVALVIMIIILYAMKDLLNLFLLTFILSYIFYNIQNYIFKNLKKFISRKIIAIFIYLLFVFFVILFFYKYMPLVINQLFVIADEISHFDINEYKLNPAIESIVKGINIQAYLNEGTKYLMGVVKNIGLVGLDLFLAFILSLFFNLDKEEIIDFFNRFEDSKISFLIKQYKIFGKSFLNSFGKVLQTQLLISLINGVLSAIMLTIMGFPQVLGLGAMIFLLGLIPIAGVWISMIPLCIIAFNIGGLIKVIDVIIMITLLHGLEGYVLNPKLMALKIKLPTFMTFLILLISEHFFGIWGLLIGIPMFVFLLDLLDVKLK
ncbi:AI-2E family transporter [Aceticella autotrophica]|nr:AI-2E family transporter [Aceticella autotrophica]